MPKEKTSLTYVVTEACIKCKYQDCVVQCPVDCFYEGENMLVIDPETCIDCGICVPDCPIDAIQWDQKVENPEFWVDFNRRYAAIWPRITHKGPVPSDADLWRDIPGKLAYFNPHPLTSLEEDDATL